MTTLSLEYVRALCKRADGHLPALFEILPRCPYGVEPVPAVQAPDAAAAFYIGPSDGCGRGGVYYINTYQLQMRPKYSMPSTSLHETVPGHHLQEIKGLPKFRLFTDWTAFVEGWALYAESLGEAMGAYADPYIHFGRYGDEILRAVRLVVDSGLHAMGWSRDQAIKYMLDNTPLTVLDATSEIDRYIAWPGQACAYKVGELTFHSLRSEAKRRLGDAFDLRRFHSSLLGSGALPLDLLNRLVALHIEGGGALITN